jgi:hypothetical protein
MPKQRDIRLVLRPLPGWPPVAVCLRRLLKALKRGYGLKCIAVEEIQHDDQRTPGPDDRPTPRRATA